MAVDDGALFGGELAGLSQDCVGHTDFANVVQKGGERGWGRR
jgi:hypothetical protein